SAERFGIDGLPGGALYEVGAAEPHEAGAFHHEDYVAQCRQVRAAGNAASHDRAHLRHMEVPPHDGVVIEDARRAVLAREDAALVGKIDACAVHQVDDGNPLAHGH